MTKADRETIIRSRDELNLLANVIDLLESARVALGGKPDMEEFS